MLEQVAHAPVKPLDVAPVTGHVDAVGLQCVVIDEILGRIVGVVRQHRGVPDKEGLLLSRAATDEFIDGLHRLATDREASVAMPSALRHPLVEAAPRKVPLPPLASLQAPVALRTKKLRQAWPPLQPVVHLFTPPVEDRSPGGRFERLERILRRIVADDEMLVRIPPRDERCQARAAEAAGHIAVGKDQAFTG